MREPVVVTATFEFGAADAPAKIGQIAQVLGHLREISGTGSGSSTGNSPIPSLPHNASTGSFSGMGGSGRNTPTKPSPGPLSAPQQGSPVVQGQSPVMMPIGGDKFGPIVGGGSVLPPQPAGVGSGSTSPVVPPARQQPVPVRPAEPQGVDWTKLIDIRRPDTAARDICRVLEINSAQATTAAQAIARQLNDPSYVVVVSRMTEPHRSRVRDAMVQIALVSLSKGDTSSSVPMMVALFQHGLVVLKGVVKTLEALLRAPQAFRAGVALMAGLTAGAQNETEGDANAVSVSVLEEALSHLQDDVLRGATNDPKLAYELCFLCKVFKWRQPKVSLEPAAEVRTHHTRMIAAATYIAQTDELVTAGWEGNVCAWKNVNSDPTWTHSLPFGAQPTAMDVDVKGSTLVVASSSPTTPTSVSVFAHEKSKWIVKTTLELGDCTAITAIKTINSRGVAYCCACHTKEGGNELRFYSQANVLVKTIKDAHEDYITCLTTSTDNEYVVLSGSRDKTCKVWDSRKDKSTKPTAVLEHHEDTITSLACHRDLILVASFDRKLSLWDSRKLKTPIGEYAFDEPLLRVACGPNATAFVASANSLWSMTIHPLQIQDVIVNRTFTELKVNSESGVLFAMGQSPTVKAFTIDQAQQ